MRYFINFHVILLHERQWADSSHRRPRSEGISRRQRRRMVANGELRVAGRGLFVTQAGGGWHHQVAAAWARRPEGAICGEAAAALYGLDGFDPGVSFETQIDPRVSHAQPGVRRHRLLQDSVDFDGIHVTAIEETLLGLGARLRPRPGCAAARQHLESIDLVELATECALHLGLTTVDSLTELLVRAPRNRPGRGVLALVLRQRPPGAPPTESYLETRCVQVLRAAALPDFQRQIELATSMGGSGGSTSSVAES